MLGVRSRTVFEIDQSTPESSAQLLHKKLSHVVDSQIKTALSLGSSGWLDLIVNNRHRELAQRIVENVDWSWTLKMKQQLIVDYLPLYQLFLLCKFVTEDFQPSPDTNRLQLSPSPMIDRLWRTHMLYPGKYLEMHTKLGFVDPENLPRMLEHQPEAAEDPYEMKANRMSSLLGYMLFICPSLSLHALTPAAPSGFSAIEERNIQQRVETATMTVTVVFSAMAKIYSFKITPFTSLLRLVDRVAQATGIPASELYLSYGGERLTRFTAGELGIADGARFDLQREQRG